MKNVDAVAGKGGRVAAVVLAGGSGSRFGAAVPKQFLPLDGRPVVMHSIALFEAMDEVDEIVVVVHRDYEETLRRMVAEAGCRKVRHVVLGGAERYLSTLNAIEALTRAGWTDDDCVLLHDAARPWVSHDVVERVVQMMERCEAVAVGVPSTDTVWQCAVRDDACRVVDTIPDRALMWRAQTPQAFRLVVLRRAYERAAGDAALVATDDCGMVRRYCPEVDIVVVEGSEANRKITFAGDMV